jgi:hemoglobin
MDSRPQRSIWCFAALDLPEGSARRALERIGHTPVDYRRAIARQHGDALRAVGIEVGDETVPAQGRSDAGNGKGTCRTTANARTLFDAASELARADKDAPLSGAHVTRALCDLEHDTAARALEKLGVHAAELAGAAEAELRAIRQGITTRTAYDPSVNVRRWGMASLYERLGGLEAITAVVDSLVTRCAGDDRINRKFERSDVPRLKKMLVDQVCEATGGPCTYTGRAMRETHEGMGVTAGEFDALVEDLVATLEEFDVPKEEQDELLGLLAPMRDGIVEVESPETGTPLPPTYQPAPALT